MTKYGHELAVPLVIQVIQNKWIQVSMTKCFAFYQSMYLSFGKLASISEQFCSSAHKLLPIFWQNNFFLSKAHYESKIQASPRLFFSFLRTDIFRILT